MDEEKKARPSVMQKLFAKVLTKIGIAAVVMIGVIYLVLHGIESSSKALKEIAEGFKSGTVVTEFRDYVTKIKGINRLQVASLESVDTFSRVDSKSVFWDWIALPDVKIEIQVPVEYTYYLDLKEKWEFKWEDKDQSIIVIAPKIQCSTPAVNISRMKIIEEKGSILRDEEEVKQKLLTELSQRLKQAAEDKIPLIRELARNETKQFITNWFINIRFKESEVKPRFQTVYFADEFLSVEPNESDKMEK